MRLHFNLVLFGIDTSTLLLVTGDLLEDCIFTLKMLIRVLQETSESVLRNVGHYCPDQEPDFARYFMVKTSYYFMHSVYLNCGHSLPRLVSSWLIVFCRCSWIELN